MGFLVKIAKGNIYDNYILDGLRDPLDPVDMTYFADISKDNTGKAEDRTVKSQRDLFKRILNGDRVPQIESDAILSAATDEALQKNISPREAIPGILGDYLTEKALNRAVLRDKANRTAAQHVMDQYAADNIKLPPPASWKSPLSYWGARKKYNAAEEAKRTAQDKANETAKRERGLRAKADAITNDPTVQRMAAEAKYQLKSPILGDAKRIYDLRRDKKLNDLKREEK